MLVETETKITEDLNDHVVELTVRHDGSYFSSFHLVSGCLDVWLTEEDLILLKKVIAKGLSTFKKVTK